MLLLVSVSFIPANAQQCSACAPLSCSTITLVIAQAQGYSLHTEPLDIDQSARNFEALWLTLPAAVGQERAFNLQGLEKASSWTGTLGICPLSVS